MQKRTRKQSVKRLGQNLTGKVTLHFYRTVINTLRQWCEELDPGDMIAFRCESADPDKQYRVWGKWLERKDSKYEWMGNPELKCYTFYKQRYVE
jgi:hypothetical protein